tara:strand:- start:848 stop:1129 length:282 start_codon:yes stop_codon:yes gene_type:complete
MSRWEIIDILGDAQFPLDLLGPGNDKTHNTVYSMTRNGPAKFRCNNSVFDADYNLDIKPGDRLLLENMVEEKEWEAIEIRKDGKTVGMVIFAC